MSEDPLSGFERVETLHGWRVGCQLAYPEIVTIACACGHLSVRETLEVAAHECPRCRARHCLFCDRHVTPVTPARDNQRHAHDCRGFAPEGRDLPPDPPADPPAPARSCERGHVCRVLRPGVSGWPRAWVCTACGARGPDLGRPGERRAVMREEWT